MANKIAAGEVVERPASVVKELLENALDAGAKSIRIEVESGGKRLIRIIDDGCGMNNDDALLAFERHATSKLRNADDLLSIATLGFRGEALPSIAAVSRLILESKTSDSTQGMRVEFAGGKLISAKPTGIPDGTSISVGDIFYCVPARRAFLKSETTELGHIASLVTHYALAHPDKHFILKTPSLEIFNVPAVEKLSDRVYQIFGRQSLQELVEMPITEGPMRASIAEPALEEGERAAAIRISGFVSRPEVQRSNRNGIYVFVNKRLIRDRLILHAISEAYRNIVPPGVFPVVLLFIDLPYQEVDVNVHPSKIEVRFRHPQFTHDFTRDAIRNALGKARSVPAFPTAHANYAGAPATAADNGGDPAGNWPQRESAMAAGAAAGSSYGGGSSYGAGSYAGSDNYVTPGALDSGTSFELSSDPLRPQPQRMPFGGPGFDFPMPGRIQHDVQNDRPAADNDTLAPSSEFSAADSAAAPAPAALPSAESIAHLKPLGQVNNSFIVAVNAEGLWIVDQHVAHERILFEQHLQARREGSLGGQRLLVPLTLELTPRQLVIFEQISQELIANGFEADLMGPRTIAIQAAPAGIAAADAEKLLVEILDGIARENQAISIDSLQAKIAASTSCHAAIKVNTPLDHEKMNWLLAQLARTSYPMSCPHGRPVVLRYSIHDIERAFKRI